MTCCQGLTDHRSQLSPATARQLSCYLSGRQAKSTPASSKAPNCHPRFSASKLLTCEGQQHQSRVYYADDLTVWATRVNIPELEDSLNGYLDEMIAYEGQFLVDCSPKVIIRVAYPGHTPSQDTSDDTHRGLTVTADIRSLPGHLPIIQQAWSELSFCCFVLLSDTVCDCVRCVPHSKHVKSATVGLVLPILCHSHVRLDGDG